MGRENRGLYAARWIGQFLGSSPRSVESVKGANPEAPRLLAVVILEAQCPRANQQLLEFVILEAAYVVLDLLEAA